MKRILILLCFLLCSPAHANLAEVKSLNDFTTANPPKNIKIEAVKNFELSKGVAIHKGDVLEGNISVKPPRRLKRDATFTFYPDQYTTENEIVKLTQKYKGKYLKPIDKGNAAKSAALTVGNKFVPGVSAGYHLVEGAVENAEGNRAKSALCSLFNNSPLSLYKKGKDLEIKQGDNFYIYLTKQKK